MTPALDHMELASSPERTTRLARLIAPMLVAGDTILLDGPVGAGKSHFCRALIQARMSDVGVLEDVPSPSFTLVQAYDLGGVEFWHVDLYRLGDPQEIHELGLDEAFTQAICLVEWAERLGDLRPRDALHLTLAPGPEADARVLRFTGPPRWHDRLAPLIKPGQVHVR